MAPLKRKISELVPMTIEVLTKKLCTHALNKMQMNQKITFQLSFLAGLICALSACVAPAAALPGQNAGEVMAWSDRHPLITRLMPGIKLQTAEPELTSTSKCQGHELSFAVWAPKGLVTRELVDYRTSDPSFDFDPKNSAGVNLIRQVYDSAVAQDFASSTLTDQRNINTVRSRYYRGSRYGYLTQHFRDRHHADRTHQRAAPQLIIVPLSQLENEVQLNKKSGLY